MYKRGRPRAFSAMAFYCDKRRCYVSKASNKRLKGLAKQLKQKYYPEYSPPKGLGKRIGPHGLAAGKCVDLAIGSLIEGGKASNQPKWARLLANRVLKILEGAGIVNLQSQVVVWSEKRQVATAVDVCGWCTKTSTQAVIEVKYSSHSLKATRLVYKTPDPQHPRFRGCGIANSIYNQHQTQLRATTRLYKQNYKGKPVSAGVLVICADGGVLFNRLNRS